jgi:hypothetical protein
MKKIPSPTVRLRGMALAGMLLALAGQGCAHKRSAYVEEPRGPGVHVRAPFVDVQVQGKPKNRVSAARDDWEDDDDQGRRISRRPINRDELDD